MTRKALLGVAAILLPVGLAATLNINSAGASSATTGTGTFNCSKVTGTITFKPPLKNGGTTPEAAAVKASATGCSGGSPKPSKVTATATIKSSNNSCAGLAGSHPISIKLTYTPVVTPSTLTGSANEVITGQTITFDVTGSVTGSYPSGSTTASGQLKQTTTQLLTECGSSAGVKSVNVVSGSLNNG